MPINGTAVTRRTAILRAFTVTAAARRLVGQTAPAGDVLSQMRNAMAAQPVVITKLAGSLHVLSGPGGNIGVFTAGDGKLAVDSGVAPASGAILQAIGGLGPQPIRILVNTHWHFDHTDGNEAFHKAGAMIFAHENVRKRVSTDQENEFFHIRMPALPPAGWPEYTFPSEATLHLGAEEIRITHIAPAHTDSDSLIQFVKANVIHAGDLVFSESYPFIDRSSGGSIGGMIEGVNRLLALTDRGTKIIPGHGRVIGPGELRQYGEMLSDIRDQVQTLKRQGRGLNAIVAANPTAKYDEKWGKGMLKPDQFLSIVFSTLGN